MTGRRWGKHGVRLTPEETNRQDLKWAAARARSRHLAAAAEQEARRLWEAGKVVPHRITMALNVRGLYGPEVDEACGVVEPDVDRWEAGELYPTWEQLGLLAELTGFQRAFFCRPVSPDPLVTSLRFHLPGYKDPPPPVLGWKPQARTAAQTPRQETLF